MASLNSRFFSKRLVRVGAGAADDVGLGSLWSPVGWGAVRHGKKPTGERYDITPGPDGNLWFTEYFGEKIGKITPAGAISEYPMPQGDDPYDITPDSFGNLWFTALSNQVIGRITRHGDIKLFPLPGSSYPWAITSGPNCELWFTDIYGNKIGKITPG